MAEFLRQFLAKLDVNYTQLLAIDLLFDIIHGEYTFPGRFAQGSGCGESGILASDEGLLEQ